MSLAVGTVLLALVALGTLLTAKNPPAQGTAKDPSMSEPLFEAQGHRGARGLFPENSLPAFEGALAIGVTTLELDVGLSKDGVLMVHHDRRLTADHSRDESGAFLVEPTPALKDLTAAEIARYDIGRLREGSESAGRYPDQVGLDGVRVPTLEAVVARMEALSGKSIRYNIEAKVSPEEPDESADPGAVAAALVALIKDQDIAGRVTVQSFDWRVQSATRALDPAIALSFLTVEQPWYDNLRRGQPGPSIWTDGLDLDEGPLTPPQAIDLRGGRVWSPFFRDLQPNDLAEAHDRGLRVIVWTVNEPADMRRLIEAGVDGIITDYPDRLRAVMAELGRPLPPAFKAE